MLCASNLRQLAIACHNYHNDYNKLPPGFLGGRPPASPSLGTWSQAVVYGPRVGVLYLILPYVEGDNLKKQFINIQEGTDTGGQLSTERWYLTTANQGPAQAKVKLFECPSDDLRTAVPTSGVITAMHWFHSWNAGDQPNWFLAEPWAGYSPAAPTGFWLELGRTNYLPTSGAAGIKGGTGATFSPFAKYEGIFSNRSKLTLGQLTVQDGTSNTLFFGETLGGQGIGVRDYVIPWMSGCVMAVGAGLGRGNVPNEDYQPNGWDITRQPRGAAWWRYSSRHAAGVQFAYGDGSIRTVRFGNTMPITLTPTTPLNDDFMILCQIAGRNDGLNVDTSSIAD